jgi:thymidylate synthase (FAD)
MVEVKFHLKLPIFVMRQLVRHRTASLNEYSGRYSIMSDDCYEPSEEYIQPQSKFNNQGRDGEMPDTWKSRYAQTINEITYKCQVAYKNLIGTGSVSHGGLARELFYQFQTIQNVTGRWTCTTFFIFVS